MREGRARWGAGGKDSKGGATGEPKAGRLLLIVVIFVSIICTDYTTN